jgi:glycosyltransferase involved in cell wall biosynthesis
LPGKPIVSAIIPAHDAAATLARAIESVLAQTVPPDEIIVVDDGSNDATSDIAQSYAVRGVRNIRLNRQKGASAARNAGIAAASGDVIAFLDSDDEWLTDKLEKQCAVLCADPGMVFAACRSNEISPSGRDLGDTFHGGSFTTGEHAWKALLALNFIATPTVVARREHILAAGGFDPALKIGEDQDLWIRLAARGRIGFVDESLVRVHLRPKSLSSADFHDQLIYTIPMIERNIAALTPRLSGAEIRAIMGERLGGIGRTAYDHGHLQAGLGLILRAVARRHRIAGNLYYLAAAAPPARWLKRTLRAGHAS